MEQVSRDSRSASEEQIDRTWPYLVGALSVCLLLSVAIYNGYPTVFADTGAYLLTGAFFIAFAPFRAPGYSLFTRVTSLGLTAWFIVAIQAVIVVYVLHETCDYLTRSDRKFSNRCLLASVCVLTTLTSLPWLVSQLMPDVFAGVLFLSAFLLAFARELCLTQRILLAVILMISVAAHLSLFPIAALFVPAVVVQRLADLRSHGVPSIKSVLVWLLVPIIAAGFCTATLNQKMGLGFKLSPSRNTFLLARLFGDGLAADFLRANCSNRPFVSCRYLSNLPQTQDEFLFQHPLQHDLIGHEEEIEAIVRGTLIAYPLRFVTSGARETLLQLTTLRTGDEMRFHNAREGNYLAIRDVFPGDIQRYSNARQFRDGLVPLVAVIAVFHTAMFWLSVGSCLILAWAGRFGRVNKFLYSAIAFLVINALICGTLAGVVDRYQSRVAWIIPFCLTVYICCLARERTRRVAGQDLTCP